MGSCLCTNIFYSVWLNSAFVAVLVDDFTMSAPESGGVGGKKSVSCLFKIWQGVFTASHARYDITCERNEAFLLSV